MRGEKKDLFAIWAAHKPAYVATVIGASARPGAQSGEGDADQGAAPDPGAGALSTGWDYDPKDTVDIGRLAVKCGMWPLKEYVDGK